MQGQNEGVLQMEDARVETANVGGKFSSLGMEWGKMEL